jgi:two-component system sensor histidine kinase YesM
MQYIRKVVNRIKDKKDASPLWAQLVLILTLMLLVIIVIISFTTYRRDRKNAVQSQVDISDRLLALKMDNLERYVGELASFCIQPCYDNVFYSYIQAQDKLPQGAMSYIKDNVRTFYFTRNDINSYQLYMLNQDKSIGRDVSDERVMIKDCTAETVRASETYRVCSASRYNNAILPPLDSNTLFRFGHAIIRVKDHRVMAIVNISVNKSELAQLTGRRAGSSEMFCLYNPDGRLLYSTDTETVSKNDTSVNNELAGREDNSFGYIVLGGEKYLVTSCKGQKYSMKLVSLIPLSELTAEFRKARDLAIFQGILFALITVAVVYFIVRLFTAPLTVLADKQKDAGRGDFSSISISGSREISNLSDSFNEMTRHINKLIQENYMYQLDEKTARLEALEAQLNPHFLYNTLQAIGSEALVNDQKNIYNMLICLASNLRYSIKAGNTVKLKDELTYADNYVALQKIRMEEKLEVESHADQDLMDVRVPKISLQLLVENSIIHGIQGEITKIHIIISISRERGYLRMSVRDDGCGISDEEQEKLKDEFRRQSLQDAGSGIGLPNLYNRIRILYGTDADLIIESRTGEGSYTEVTLRLPVDPGEGAHGRGWRERDNESTDN